MASPPMKICGTGSGRSGGWLPRAPGCRAVPRFRERERPCGSAGPWRARSRRTRAGCSLDIGHRFSFGEWSAGALLQPRIGHAAATSTSRRRPAASSTRVQAAQVAPEVITSSTSSTRRPAMWPSRPGRRRTVPEPAAPPRRVRPAARSGRVRRSASGTASLLARRPAHARAGRPGCSGERSGGWMQRHRHDHLGLAQQAAPARAISGASAAASVRSPCLNGSTTRRAWAS